MDTFFQAIFSWQFLLFCLAVSAIVFVLRQVVEFVLDNPKVPASKTSKVWKELVLPILPVFLGVGFALLAKNYPYPEGLTSSSGRLAFGLVGGLSSGLIYRLYKSFLGAQVKSLSNKVSKLVKKEDINTEQDK